MSPFSGRYIRENIKRANKIVVRTPGVKPGTYTYDKELPWIKKYKKDVEFVGPENKHIDKYFGKPVTGKK